MPFADSVQAQVDQFPAGEQSAWLVIPRALLNQNRQSRMNMMCALMILSLFLWENFV